MRKYVPFAAIAAITLVVAPRFVVSMACAVTIFGLVAFAGAWLMERYGDLPGGDRRCA